jgi:hypothetical protein
MSDAELLAPTTEPAPASAAEPEPQAAAPAAVTVDDDAAFEESIAAQTIDIPDGEKLVPLSAVTGAREKIRTIRGERDTYKQQAERAPQLEQELQQLREQLNQVLPGAQAYQALLAAQQAQPAQSQEPAEDVGELEDIARDLDLYKVDGTPDIDKARKIHARQVKVAESVARQQVAPLENHSIQQASNTMLARALMTEVQGAKADPAILQSVWRSLDPRLTATESGAKEALLAALARSFAAGKVQIGQPVKKQAATELPDPLLTEKAGGRDMPAGIALTDGDRRVARDMGMTDKEYAETAAKMPWRK